MMERIWAWKHISEPGASLKLDGVPFWCNDEKGVEVPANADLFVSVYDLMGLIHPDVIAQFIRKIDGTNEMGACELGEKIANMIKEKIYD